MVTPPERMRAQAKANADPFLTPTSDACGSNHARKVFIISFVRLYYDGLARSLADRALIEVVGAGAPNHETIEAIGATAAHIILVDSNVARHSGIVRLITHVSPDSIVVAFGVNDDPTEVLACAESGVAGYVPTDASVDDLVRVIESVERGELICSPRVAAQMFRRVATLAERPVELAMDGLTIREREIVDHMCDGKSNKEIAAALCIELATVKTHVHHILEKLGVTGRAALSRRSRVNRQAQPSSEVMPRRTG